MNCADCLHFKVCPDTELAMAYDEENGDNSGSWADGCENFDSFCEDSGNEECG